MASEAGTPDDDAGPLACFSIDRESRITDWTRAAERLVGWTAAQANGRRVDDLIIAPTSLSSYHAELAVLATAGPTRGWLRVYVTHRDGRHVSAGLSLTPVPGNREISLHVAMRPRVTPAAPRHPDPDLLTLPPVLDCLRVLHGIDGTVVCDSGGHLLLIAGVLEQIFGSAEGRAEDGSWATRVAGLRHGDGQVMPRHDLPLVRALRGETFRDSPFVVDPHGAPQRHFLASGTPVHGNAEAPLGAMVTVREVPPLPPTTGSQTT